MSAESGGWSRQDQLQDAVSKFPIAMVLTNPRLPDNPIVYVNRAFEEVTFYSRNFAVGQNCRFLQGEKTDPADVAKLRRAIEDQRDISIDIVNHRADGSAFMNRLVIAPLHDENGELDAFIGIQKAIDGGEETVDQGSLEQDQMLRELQHRVKNHLAMIVGMIRMQAKREISKEAFHSLSHRVQSLALLYEELSPVGVVNRKGENVPAGAYLSRVAHTLGALEGRSSIRINVECEEIELPVDLSARLGLLLTEFMTNALEHAFPHERDGVVRVRFQRLTGNAVRMSVVDDGIGMPADSDWPQSDRTVESFAESKAEEPGGDAMTVPATDGKSLGRGKIRSGMGGTIVQGLVRGIGGALNVSRGMRGTIVTLDVDLNTD